MRRAPKRDPSAAYVREAIARRRIGDKKCRVCRETRPWAFNGPKSEICERCERERLGHKTTDDHHLAGDANNPSIMPVDVNDHRARLSPDQHDWPRRTLKNTDGDPLLAAAGCMRGFIDYIYYAIEKYLLWVPVMLETLSEYLEDKLGRKWWQNTPVERFSPKRRRNVFP
jgi:hypothetical protein